MSWLAAIKALAELPSALAELSAELRRLNGVLVKAAAQKRKERKDDEVDKAIDRVLRGDPPGGMPPSET